MDQGLFDLMHITQESTRIAPNTICVYTAWHFYITTMAVNYKEHTYFKLSPYELQKCHQIIPETQLSSPAMMSPTNIFLRV